MIPGSANPLLLKSAAAAAGGYQIQRSLRFNSSDSGFCSRTPAVAGNRRTWTWSSWIKRGALGTTQVLFFAGVHTTFTDSAQINLQFTSGDKLRLETGATALRVTTQVFRDPSAWYHIVLQVDTTQSSASNQFKLYINGTQITTFDTLNGVIQNTDLAINNNVAHNIGAVAAANTSYLSAYLAETYLIDGQALDYTSFTEVSATTGQLVPIAYTGTYGTNGFQLKFADNSSNTASTLGKDTSGNSNNWTPNNLSVTAGAGNDSLVDTPTSFGTDTGVGGEVRGNYCTWNPLYANGTLSNGNLDVSTTTTNATTGTIFATSGKWYWETTVTTSNFNRIGVVNLAGAGQNLGGTANSWAILNDGQVYTNSVTAAYGPSYGVNDVISIALDIDAGKIWYGKNGTWLVSGNPSTGANPSQTFTAGQTMAPAVASGSGTCAYVLNAGARSFAYTNDRTGFKALCDTNLGAPLVAKPNTVMDVVLYTGNNGTQVLPNASSTPTSLNFSPGFLWIKTRSVGYSHVLTDKVRGDGKILFSNATAIEETTNRTALGTNNFTLIDDGSELVNHSPITYAAWCWDAGTSTVSNTSGSITSQVRANVSAGFSIATFTQPSSSSSFSWGHGLNVAPQFAIMKPRGSSGNWQVYHTSIGAQYLWLNDTVAATGTGWSTVNSSIITATASLWGGSNLTTVAYCFAPVVGYSSFGSYTGNGLVDGPFVYTGFRPRWVMIKRATGTSGGSAWLVYDALRPGYNLTDLFLIPNTSDAEQSGSTNNPVDILSNGFKIRWSTASSNASSETFIYAAFAENPFQYARAR